MGGRGRNGEEEKGGAGLLAVTSLLCF